MKTCEKRLDEKERDIKLIEERCKNYENEIYLLRQQVKDLTVQSITSQEAVRNLLDCRSLDDSAVERICACAVNNNKSSPTAPHELLGNTERLLCNNEDLLHENQKSFQDKYDSELYDSLKTGKLSPIKRVKKLEKTVGILGQLVANKEIVFKWTLDDYVIHREAGYVYSRKFYSSNGGHCCRLWLQWYGTGKETLGLWFQLCRDEWGETAEGAFEMNITLEIVGKAGGKKVKQKDTVVSLSFRESGKGFKIPDGKDGSVGSGCKNILSMPQLRDFVADDDRLIIVCTLTPE